MNEAVQQYQTKITEYWKKRSNTQKLGIVGGILGFIFLLVLTLWLIASPNMVPLYTNLSLKEAGQLRTELQDRGIRYELVDGGTTILVPESEQNELIVEFAAQGIPNSGNIDYSFFSQNVSWGMTDEERQIIEIDALNTELANLIKTIEGISDAKVLITKSPESIFVGEKAGESSASIVLNTDYGHQFTQDQIRGLYHLVSKAVPNLPTDNIVIRNQYLEYFDLENSNNFGTGNTYQNQQAIKSDIERDIERRVQRLLGTMIGQDKVVVSVTTDIDFTQENRLEQIIEPVDLENMDGVPISIDRVTETYTGYGGAEFVQGEADINNLPAIENGDQFTEYEMVRETINNEFNHIQREIVESPYKIRDIGIQVAVDNSVEENGDLVVLSAAEQQSVEQDIQSILSSIIQTSIPGDTVDLGNPGEKVSIVFQQFSRPDFGTTTPTISVWTYVLGALLLLVIIILLFVIFRRKKEEEELVVTEEEDFLGEEDYRLEVDENETTVRRKQLEQLAKDKPDEFAKLLRTWITED
ncbi:flagellar basal-body MS-ring/collar protein FliF [Bacillaceae bacterium W0354]